MSRRASRSFSSLPLSPALILGALIASITLTACPGDGQLVDPDAQSVSSDATAPGDAAGPIDGPGDPDGGPGSTAVGIISIQDQVIHGFPAAGHGLSVRADFTLPPRAPDFDESPGQPTGCKAWLYDIQEDPPPLVAGDEGTLFVDGTGARVPNGCSFDGASGYICPVAGGSGAVVVAPVDATTALYEVSGLELGSDDVGRHLRVDGSAGDPGNRGQFPILSVRSAGVAVLANPAARVGSFEADYAVLAGAGAAGIPLDSPADPIRDGDAIVVGIEPGGRMDFDFADSSPIDAGDSFALDDASAARIAAIPVDGSPFSLGCGGAGGRCGAAFVSIIQLETTDGDLAGASRFALPPAIDKKVIVSCATLGGSGVVEVPEEAARLLRAADEASPITRIRVAFMRDGFAAVANPAPLPPNPVRIVVGHQIVAFTDLVEEDSVPGRRLER